MFCRRLIVWYIKFKLREPNKDRSFQVSGGALFGFLGHLTAKRGRDPIIITGFVLSMLSYFLMFLNLPFNSNLGETQPSDTAYITSNQYLAVLTGFILGFSDSCFNTQVSAHWTKYIIVLLKNI